MDTGSQKTTQKTTEAQRACGRRCCRSQPLVFGLLVGAQFLLVGFLIFGQPSPRQSLWTGLLFGCGIAIGLWAIISMGRGNLTARPKAVGESKLSWPLNASSRVLRWAPHVSPAVRDHANLVECGPYRWVRHPMYTALLLFALSYVLADISPRSLQLWFGLLLVLVVKSCYEESLLAERFPRYTEYKKRTWRFMPFF